MRSRLPTVTTSILLLVVSAAATTFIDQLPACWQTCFQKRDPQCDSTDINCLCQFAANHTSLPTLLICVRKRCNTKYYPEFLTAPLKVVQTACDGTKYKISDAAVSKADAAAKSAYSAAEGAYSAVVRVEGGSASRTTTVASNSDSRTTITKSTSLSSSTSGAVIIPSATTSSSASSSVASAGPTTGASIATGLFTTGSTSSVAGASTSTAPGSKETGGTPLDIGQQGAGVTKRAGSFLGLAIAFVFAVIS